MKILIVTGGKINDDFALAFLENNNFDYIIAADRGMEFLQRAGINPNYLVGDFDSISEEILAKAVSDKIIRYNSEKDFTDTEAAMKLAIELAADEIVLLGATGTRIDHMMANINTLYLALEKGVPAYMLDENNRIRLINSTFTVEKSIVYNNTISFIPYSDVVEGVSLTGFYYPLENKTLSKFLEPSLGVSNKLIGDKGEIKITNGILIMIEARD